MKIAIGCNTSRYAWFFRGSLIRELIGAGHSVVVVAPEDEYSSKLKDIQAKHVHLQMKMNKNPVGDIAIYQGFKKIFKHENPDAYLGYTVKPNVYGSLAAQRLNIPVINNIAGLGYTFINKGITTRVVKLLYKLALKKSHKVFFQNTDDLDLFKRHNLVGHERVDLLPGSGVDLEKFSVAPQQHSDSTCNFLMIARLIREKGILEYVSAAEALRANGIKAKFKLLGFIDKDNPGAIPEGQLIQWVQSNTIEFLGHADDVRDAIASSNCVVLPSYREGTPRSLLEAAAMGRLIITTDTPGCRHVLVDGITGFLCKPRDANELAIKMTQVANMALEERRVMGLRGRSKMEQEFSEGIVIDKYLNELAAISTSHNPN